MAQGEGRGNPTPFQDWGGWGGLAAALLLAKQGQE